MKSSKATSPSRKVFAFAALSVLLVSALVLFRQSAKDAPPPPNENVSSLLTDSGIKVAPSEVSRSKVQSNSDNSKLEGVPYDEREEPPSLAKAKVNPLPPQQESPAIVRQDAPSTATPASQVKKLPPNSKRLGSTERAERLLELQKEAAEEKDHQLAQRTLLTVAGYHVGDGDWDKAKELYDQMSTSPFPEIRATVARNLNVVERNQAILAEPDAGRREWMELELAAVHQQYGHEKFSKTLYRALEKDATQAAVRQAAAERLATYVSPPLVVPQAPQPQPDSK